MRRARATLAKQENIWRGAMSSESLRIVFQASAEGGQQVVLSYRTGCGDGPEESFLKGFRQKTAVPPAAGVG